MLLSLLFYFCLKELFEIIFTLPFKFLLDSCALYFLICCSIFKDRAASLASSLRAAGFLFYHICFRLSRGFLTFFRVFFGVFRLPFPSLLRRPIYYTITAPVCQYLFRNFFSLFFSRPLGLSPSRLVYYITSFPLLSRGNFLFEQIRL